MVSSYNVRRDNQTNDDAPVKVSKIFIRHYINTGLSLWSLDFASDNFSQIENPLNLR